MSAAPVSFDFDREGGSSAAFAKNDGGNGNGGGNGSGNGGGNGSGSGGSANGGGAGNASGNSNAGGAGRGRSNGKSGLGSENSFTTPVEATSAASWLGKKPPLKKARGKAITDRDKARRFPATEKAQTLRGPELSPDRGSRGAQHAQGTFVASGVPDAAFSTLSALGFQVEVRTKGTLGPKVATLKAPDGVSLSRARQMLRQAAPRAAIDLDHYYYPDGAPPDCEGQACATFSLVGWDSDRLGQCGPLPLIGMVDTAIDVENAALVGQSLEVIDGGPATAQAGTDHGTAIAALLIGRSDSTTPGLFPHARLVAVSAFERTKDGNDRMDVASLVAAIETLLEKGVGVINLSLSGPPNAILEQAVASAYAKGVVLVAAAGNEGPGAPPSYPGAYPQVVSVTAVDRDLNVYKRANAGDYVDVAAPGVNIWTATSSAHPRPRSGTSYAVPFVTAAAALLKAANRSLSPGEVQSGIALTAEDLGSSGRDPIFGWGLVQPARLCIAPAGVQDTLERASVVPAQRPNTLD